jgi:hypothetical protein
MLIPTLVVGHALVGQVPLEIRTSTWGQPRSTLILTDKQKDDIGFMHHLVKQCKTLAIINCFAA